MTDKEKIKNEIQRRIDLLRKDGKLGSDIEIVLYGLINFIDSIQEELKSKFKKGDIIYYDSFGEVESMIVANVVDNGDGIPMYEDAEGNAVFENELIEEPASEDRLRKASEEYLKMLSETPYNNTPVTNAQTIIKELVSYLDNPSEYYPDHVTDVSKDLEEEIERYFTLWYDNEGGGCIKPDRWLNNLEDCMDIARHFAEWQKQQIMKGFPTWKKSEKLIEGALLDRGILYIPRYMIELSELKKLPKED